MATEKTISLLKQFLCGTTLNVDLLAGFEAGMRSVRSWPPTHLTGNRLVDWCEGKNAAIRYLQTRRTYFNGETGDGTKVEIVRKGWVARGPVISMMERKGVSGDVFVSYVDGARGSSARTVKCGI